VIAVPLILLLRQAAVAASPPETIDYAQAWSKTQQAIERSYYGRVSRKKEMEDRLKRFAPLASSAKTKAEFRNTVDDMIAEFKDSHFEFLTDEDQGYYLMDGLASRNPAAMPEIGAWFKREGNDYRVQMVLNGTEAEKAGLRKGDLVTNMDGKPFTPIDALKPEVDKTATIHVVRDGKEMDKQVKVESKPALEMFLDATRDSARVIERGGKRIGYVHLWTEASDKFSAALSSIVYNQFRNTDACILDLRDGFGGRPEGYGDPFFRPEVQLDWKYSANGTTHEMFGYQRPLVVLINGGTRSAKEVLSFVFKKSKRGTLIGSNTAGNVLGTAPTRLNSWAYLEIPIVEVYADGIRLEGRGVAPDIFVKQEFDKDGKDLYVEEALAYLSRAKG